jgi:membrane associated rhomboid family serine protease
MVHNNEWYRMLTHGFIHGSYPHLIINMIVLYSFGKAIEYYFGLVTEKVIPHYFVLYFGGMIVSTITTTIKRRNNPGYMAVGASGAVSAVLFACIFFAPWHKLLLMGVIPIPGIVFAVLYVLYSSYMSKKGNDNIGHDAHLWGALFGLIYPIVIHPDLFESFIYQLTHPTF